MSLQLLVFFSGADETRTRDLRRDRTAERLGARHSVGYQDVSEHFPASYAASRVHQRTKKKVARSVHRTTSTKTFNIRFILSHLPFVCQERCTFRHEHATHSQRTAYQRSLRWLPKPKQGREVWG